MSDYPIIQLPPLIETFDEVLGTKPKFWCRWPPEMGPVVLFKKGRINEDWSEKVAAELAPLLGLPAATVELATYRGKRGTLSPTFVRPEETLYHGNDLLFELDPDYPKARVRKAVGHTVPKVVRALSQRQVLASSDLRDALSGAAAQFVGYLMFDAWIGNTDRQGPVIVLRK